MEDGIERSEKQNQCLLRGVPYVVNKDLNSIVTNLCNNIGFSLEVTIIHSFRLGLKKFAKSPEIVQAKKRLRSATSSVEPKSFNFLNILMTFESAVQKNRFFKLFYSHKDLNLSSIGFPSDGRIYVTDNLTRNSYAIFREATKYRVAKGWQLLKLLVNWTSFVKTRRIIWLKLEAWTTYHFMHAGNRL